MTKGEYNQYLRSDLWKSRRDAFLSKYDRCANCKIPRWLAILAYSQDLNVDHLSYERVRIWELDSDLQALCRRCHELKHFGKSIYHPITRHSCLACPSSTFDAISKLCDNCKFVSTVSFQEAVRLFNEDIEIIPAWQEILARIAGQIGVAHDFHEKNPRRHEETRCVSQVIEKNQKLDHDIIRAGLRIMTNFLIVCEDMLNSEDGIVFKDTPLQFPLKTGDSIDDYLNDCLDQKLRKQGLPLNSPKGSRASE